MACGQTILSAPRSDATFYSVEDTSWYAIYTRARHEKRVAQELAHRSIEVYLPLYETARQWKNGRHFVQMPLFPGYAFVHMALRNRISALRAPGVVDFVGYGGRPASLEAEEITNLRRVLGEDRKVEPHPFLNTGRKVRVTAGPLTGLEGVVVRRKGQVQLVVSVELIQRSVLVEVDSTELEPRI
jgi:transcription termination/antitermination protein NusG